jgi:hypothetical protein
MAAHAVACGVMGEAKQRAQREAAQRACFGAVDFARISAAVRMRVAEGSDPPALDALRHARLARHLLQRAGLESDLMVGFSAWRVGPGVGDIVAHGGSHDPRAESSRRDDLVPPHHAWVETGGHVYDATTYQLARKAADLSRPDGAVVSAVWCPDFVLTPRASLASFARVRQPVVGLMYYARDAYLQSIVLQQSVAPDPQDLARLEHIYRDLSAAPSAGL